MKVGDYVRTEDGYIAKIINIDNDNNYCFFDSVVFKSFGDTYESCSLDNICIIKSSSNIIDLIEIGDYVNGHLVKNRRASCNENLGGHPKQVDIGENEDYIWISESKIKTIVTKEQFKNMEYEVE